VEATLASNVSDHDPTITAEDALAIAREAAPASPTGIHHPASELSVGQKVVIRHKTQSSDPDITGRLRYIDLTRVSIDHESVETGSVAVHLPVAGYSITAD
jgi:hypothetical protein